MSLDRVRRAYETLGKEDPLWAILTDDRYRFNRWDPTEFFETGRREIREVMAGLVRHGMAAPSGTALDFGCGVGRLSQALCEHFDAVIGIDISSTMIEKAEAFNRHAGRCRYVVNVTERLESIGASTIDFVYTYITLQHVPPAFQIGYIREFLRVLRPGGVTVFQVRTGASGSWSPLSGRLQAFRAEFLRPFWKVLRGRPPVQVHILSERDVQDAIASGGGRTLEVASADKRERRSRRSLRYTVIKPPATAS
jgi:SAM-dependent methyltransferase